LEDGTWYIVPSVILYMCTKIELNWPLVDRRQMDLWWPNRLNFSVAASFPVFITVAGSEFPLVETRGSTDPHTSLEVCSGHKDKTKIKCMGSAGGKTPE